MRELIDRARAAAQHSREYGPGTNAPLLDELADALEAAREDAERLDWLDIQRGDDVRQDTHSGDPVLVAHHWAIEGQCTGIRDAIDTARAADGGA